jgi:hypothetical protein
MPAVPLLVGLIALQAVALVALLVAERRAAARRPDAASLRELRARVDALGDRYRAIAAEVAAIVDGEPPQRPADVHRLPLTPQRDTRPAPSPPVQVHPPAPPAARTGSGP